MRKISRAERRRLYLRRWISRIWDRGHLKSWPTPENTEHLYHLYPPTHDLHTADIPLYQFLLTFLFLCAAVVEVDVLCGELQTTRININHRDQLTVLWDHQLLLLTRLFRISPYRTMCTKCVFTCTTFFLKKLILSFSEDALNWSKVAVKTFIML